MHLTSLHLAVNMSKSLVVETCTGKVEGCLDKSSLGPEFYAFRGVPYAEPPVDSLRFAVSF